MTMLSPKEFLNYTLNLQRNMALTKTKEIAVGLPISSSLSKKIYKKKKNSKGKSIDVITVGQYHEYGLGHNPVRSFLRVPFAKNKTKIETAFSISFKKIADGGQTIPQMERLGILLKNISSTAFTTQGYGSWKPIKKSTAKAKGMEDITARLTETGTLKQSITYVVRNVTS